jgi:hypothetical protein
MALLLGSSKAILSQQEGGNSFGAGQLSSRVNNSTPFSPPFYFIQIPPRFTHLEIV